VLLYIGGKTLHFTALHGEMPNFISLDFRPWNSPDLNPAE